MTPRVDPPPGQGAIGVKIQARTRPVAYNPLESIWLGFRRAVSVIAFTLAAPVMVIQGSMPGEMLRPIGLPGMAQVTSQAVEATRQSGYLYPLLVMTGTFSAGLAIANMLPIPALDGGRLFFIIIEAVRGRRISPERESLVHFVGHRGADRADDPDRRQRHPEPVRHGRLRRSADQAMLCPIRARPTRPSCGQARRDVERVEPPPIRDRPAAWPSSRRTPPWPCLDGLTRPDGKRYIRDDSGRWRRSICPLARGAPRGRHPPQRLYSLRRGSVSGCAGAGPGSRGASRRSR